MTSVHALRLLERVHGHLGWLSALALLHPAVLLRRRARRAQLAVVLATALVTVTGAFGALLYPDYRGSIKQRLFVQAPQIGWLFERKEHLAVGALALAWMGCVAHLSAPSFPAGALRERVSAMAHHAFVASAALATATAIAGLLVAAELTF